MARILIIDDDKQLLDLLTAILEREGHDIIAVSDGSKVMDICRDQKPDLVITDLIMPGKDGMEVISELKHDFSGIKILVISGGGTTSPEEDLELSQKMGVQHSLRKPFARKELLKIVDNLIK